jgi:hypothetical protein
LQHDLQHRGEGDSCFRYRQRLERTLGCSALTSRRNGLNKGFRGSVQVRQVQ